MEKIVCVIGGAFLCLSCGGMNQETWKKYDREVAKTEGLTSAEDASAGILASWKKDVFYKWVTEKEAVISSLVRHKKKLEDLLQDVQRDYECINKYGMDWGRLNSLCRVLLKRYPIKTESFEAKMEQAREEVQPGMYNTISGAVSRFFSCDKFWIELDAQLKAVDKNLSLIYLADKVLELEGRISAIERENSIIEGAKSNQERAVCTLKSRVGLIKKSLQTRMSGLSNETKQLVVSKALDDVEANFAILLSSKAEESSAIEVEGDDAGYDRRLAEYATASGRELVRSLIGSGQENYLDRIGGELEEGDQISSLNLFLDQFVLSVNDKLLGTLYETSLTQGIERVGDNEWRLYNSNFSCSQSFSRGGWVSVKVGEKSAKLSFSASDDRSWKDCDVTFGRYPLFNKCTFVAPGSVANVFYGFVCSIIAFNPDSEMLFLLGKGEGNRTMCVAFGQRFIFVGDLVSGEQLANFTYADTSVYLKAVVESGTFVDEESRVSVSNVNFGEALTSFKNKTLRDQEQFPWGTPKKSGKGDFFIIRGSPISLKKKSSRSVQQLSEDETAAAFSDE